MKNKAYFLLFTSLILAFNLYWLVEIYNNYTLINTNTELIFTIWLVGIMSFISLATLFVAYDEIFNDPYQIKQ